MLTWHVSILKAGDLSFFARIVMKKRNNAKAENGDRGWKDCRDRIPIIDIDRSRPEHQMSIQTRVSPAKTGCFETLGAYEGIALGTGRFQAVLQRACWVPVLMTSK